LPEHRRHQRRRLGRGRAAEPVPRELRLAPRGAAAQLRALPDRGAAARGAAGAADRDAQLPRGAADGAPARVRALRLPHPHRVRPGARRAHPRGPRRGAPGGRGGAGAGVEPLREQLRAHLRGRLRGRLLQLQVGRGAGGGRLRGLRGERRLRSRHRAALPRRDPLARRQPRRPRGLHRVPRPASRPARAPQAARHPRRRRARPVSAPLGAALAAAGLALLARPGRAAESLYVVEQVTVSVNGNPDGSGERVASLKSGDRVELVERSGEQVHVRLADGREGWLRAVYLSGDAPLRPRLAQSEAEVARLNAEVTRLQGELAAAAKSTVPSAPPVEDATPGAPAPLIGTGPETPQRVWPWARGSARLALLVGFALGWHMLDRKILRKYGGLRIY